MFLRHGVAHHNFHGADLRSPQLFDPPLTRDGKISAVQAGDKIQYWWSTTQGGNRIETVITSPLSRTLQTATLAFLPGEAYGEECVPFLCVENVREAYGMHYPDKRRKRSVLMVRSLQRVECFLSRFLVSRNNNVNSPFENRNTGLP